MTSNIKPVWRIEDVESPYLIADLSRKYTDNARALVVYQFGSVIFSDIDQHRSDRDYSETLFAAVQHSPNFSVRTMNDQNFVVRFQGPVSGLVMKGHYEKIKDELKAAVESGKLDFGATMAPGIDGIPEDHYYVGMYARAKLYFDFDNPIIAARRP